jgi:phage tail-like protein
MPSDQRREDDWVGAYNFAIELEGLEVALFKAVSGVGTEIELIEYRTGKDLYTRKRPGRPKYNNITLKRGVTTSNHGMLWQWFKLVLDGKSTEMRKSGSIVLKNDKLDEVARYNFEEAWPCKWKGWELDGASSNAAVEEVELVVERVYRVPDASTGD